jgi:two-component system sensor histidine kinase YesM
MRLKIGNDLSIKTKLIILILSFLCLPFLILGTLWYEKSSSIIESNAIHSNQQLVMQVSNQMDSYFADLERSTFPLIINPLIQQFMEVNPSDQYQLFKVTQEIEKNLLPNILFGRSDIYGFSILSNNGIATTYGGTGARERNKKYMSELTDSENYKNMGINEIDSTPILTVTRKFRDTLTYQTKGMLITDLYISEIAKIAENVKLGDAGFVWVIDSNGRIVYHPDSRKWGKEASPSYLENFNLHQSEGYFSQKLDGQNKLVIFHKSTLNGWIMVSEVPIQELIGNLIGMRNMTMWVGGLLILFVLLMVSGFSFKLTRSLSHLQRLMKKAENGDLNVRAPERNNDEIGKLNRSFNKMVSEIRRLIEVVHTSKLKEKENQIKQRESALQAMQSQINPHFLYNTLEVINSYAILEGIMPISSMATSLADIFRYSVGNPNQVVTLADEITHINTYFAIQKERYRYFLADFQLNELMLPQVQAVRLMIQPIVENAFFHGYEEHNLKPEYIGISDEITPDYYRLTITDKGKGMLASQMERYNRLFLNEMVVPGDEEAEPIFHKIGLLNVHHRLRLTFGSPYGLYIEKSDESGTVISIKLPYLTTTTA